MEYLLFIAWISFMFLLFYKVFTARKALRRALDSEK